MIFVGKRHRWLFVSARRWEDLLILRLLFLGGTRSILVTHMFVKARYKYLGSDARLNLVKSVSLEACFFHSFLRR